MQDATLSVFACCAAFAMAACGDEAGDGGGSKSGSGGKGGSGGSGQAGSGNGGTGNPPPAWAAAVGRDGTLVQTFDEVTWEARKVSEQDLYSVACVGNDLAWVAGERGTLLHSADTGASWTPLEVPTDQALRGVRFATGGGGLFLGVTVGDSGTLLVSSDAGATWRSVEVAGAPGLRGVAIANDLSLVVVVGDEGSVLTSVDRGASFDQRRLEGAGNLTSVAVAGFADEILIGDDQGDLWVSHDHAEHFVRERGASWPIASVSLAFGAEWALAAGAGGVLYRNGTGTWATSHLPRPASFAAAMVAHDSRSGFVAGPNGLVLRTLDHGVSFELLDSKTNAGLNALENMNGY